jgi:hypothetical protein
MKWLFIYSMGATHHLSERLGGLPSSEFIEFNDASTLEIRPREGTEPDAGWHGYWLAGRHHSLFSIWAEHVSVGCMPSICTWVGLLNIGHLGAIIYRKIQNSTLISNLKFSRKSRIWKSRLTHWLAGWPVFPGGNPATCNRVH